MCDQHHSIPYLRVLVRRTSQSLSHCLSLARKAARPFAGFSTEMSLTPSLDLDSSCGALIASHLTGYALRVMERMGWTDARLDDLSRRVDAGFARVDADIRELRVEIRSELGALRLTLSRVGGGVMIGLVGVIAAVVAGG